MQTSEFNLAQRNERTNEKNGPPVNLDGERKNEKKEQHPNQLATSNNRTNKKT